MASSVGVPISSTSHNHNGAVMSRQATDADGTSVQPILHPADTARGAEGFAQAG